MPARIIVQDPTLEWRGTWRADVQYDLHDLVEYNGSSYVAKGLVIGEAPIYSELWDLFAEGKQGPPGPQGPAGGGAVKYSGMGPPGVIIGAEPGDTYLDALTGTIYILQ